MRDFSYIERNLAEVRDDIARIAASSGRPVPTLVCVTKSGSDDELLALVRAGASDIGENRPGELKRRGDLLSEAGLTPTLHEIGNLQRNKVKYVIERAALIHSLDSIPLAEEIERLAAKRGITRNVLIEINSGREEAKGGVLPEAAEEFFLSLKRYPHLSVRGLMTMGPACEGEEIRKYFALTRELFDKLNTRYGFAGEPVLSMGMSDSYKIAIEEGSTLVRIGRRLFKNEGEKENV